MSDKWSGAFVILTMLSLVLVSISEKLYEGENSAVILIIMAAAILCLLGRWIFLIIRSLGADSSKNENAAEELTIRSKQGAAVFLLSFTAFWVIMWYLDKHNPRSWITGILVIFFAIGAVAALVERPR